MTPFDREDIYALAGAIDDVVDDIEEVSEQLALREIEAPMEQAQALAGVLRDSGRSLARALDGLESLDGIDEHLADDPPPRAGGRHDLPAARSPPSSTAPSTRCS